MISLSKEQIICLHQSLINYFGGDSGIRDENLLDLSVHSPYQTFDDLDLYQGIIKKAVHLCFSLIKNHPFVDGNKRIGTHAMLVLLELNGYSLDYSQEDLINIILDIASSQKNEHDLVLWIKNHII